jgi:hypothetical protein
MARGKLSIFPSKGNLEKWAWWHQIELSADALKVDNKLESAHSIKVERRTNDRIFQ